MATARVIPAAATSGATSCLLARTPLSLNRRAVSAGGLCFFRRAGAAPPPPPSSTRRLFACRAIYNPQVQVKEEGKPETLDYRVFLVDNSGKKMSPLA
ncbi:hypothetical protein NL676_039041 [Syzygium grande]|nr:hypothetical protein NL676_039041 [Syzygium grande]